MWFKDCKLDTRGFVGLEWHILIAVYDHLFSKRIIGSKTYLYTIPPRFYELCVFILFTTKKPLLLHTRLFTPIFVQHDGPGVGCRIW